MTNGVPPHAWIVDSGASRHLTGNRSLLRNIRKLPQTVAIKLADGFKVNVSEEGDVLMKTPYGDRTIKSVAYCNGLSVNLISVGKLCKRNIKVVFDKDSATMYKRNSIMFTAPAVSRDLYVLDATAADPHTQHDRKKSIKNEFHSVPNIGSGLFLTPEHESLWHQRLGHVNSVALNRMHNESLVRGLTTHAHSINCGACARAKSTRAPFGENLNRIGSVAPLERVHSDLMGPINIKSHANARYVLTITDEFTDYVWQYYLANKSDAADKIIEWHTLVKNQHADKVLEFHTDHGGEFISTQLLSYWRAHGVIASTTPRSTPQYNAIAERKNRTIMEATRACLLHAKLPARYWQLAMEAVVHVQNKSIRNAKRIATPHEFLFRVKPSVSHIRVFGCDAIIHDKLNGSKESHKGVDAIFIGYEPLRMAYRFFDPVGRRIVIERDAVFDENNFTVASSQINRLMTVKELPIVLKENVNTDQIENKDNNGSSNNLVPNIKVKPLDIDELLQMPKLDNGVDNNINNLVPVPASSNAPLPAPVPILAPMHASSSSNVQHYEMIGKVQHGGSRIPNPRLRRINQEGAHVATTSASSNYEDPLSYNEAMQSNDKSKWQHAMDEEMESQHKCHSWISISRDSVPNHKRILKCRWVYKTKRDADGNIIRYKCRVVAKGFMQRFGEDYFETFAPVMAYKTLRVLLSLAAIFDYEIKQFDIVTAFLHAPIKEELYMELPEGYDEPGMVVKLKRAVYGIKQAPRAWNDELNSHLISLGFKRLRSDACVYIRGKIIIGIFVDDIIGIYPKELNNEWLNIKSAIFNKFTAKDLGDAKFILGMRVTRDRENNIILLDQAAYIKKIADKFQCSGRKQFNTPLDCRPTHIDCPTDTDATEFMKQKPYREVIGSLLYAAISTRPDILYSVSALAQYCNNPGINHYKSALRVVNYLINTNGLSLKLGGNRMGTKINIFSDADWAGDKDDAKSMNGVITMLGEGAVTWTAKKQSLVALSSMESEYVAMVVGAQDAIWLNQLLIELRHSSALVPRLNIDNQSAIAYCKTGGDAHRTRHINLKYHFVRDHVEKNNVELHWVASKMQLADILTKPLDRAIHERLRKYILVAQ